MKIHMNRLHLVRRLAAFAIIASAYVSGGMSSIAQSQGQMNVAAAREYHKADAKLNTAYQRLVKGLDSTPKARLIKAQRAWIAFRDAEASFRASEFIGGTAEPAAYWTYLTDLTVRRTNDLNLAYKDLVAE